MLTGGDTASSTFTAPTVTENTKLTFRLAVTSDGQSTTDTVSITVDAPPTANAGDNQIVASCGTVSLNGSASSDPGGGTLDYSWSQIEGVSRVTLDDDDTFEASFAADTAAAKASSDDAWRVLGEQVYGNNCASCHQQDGSGLSGIFPPLTDNPAVLADDPTDHTKAILDGIANKVIDGVAYPAPMPGFGTLLNDAEVAAVVNYERTEWGNEAPLGDGSGHRCLALGRRLRHRTATAVKSAMRRPTPIILTNGSNHCAYRRCEHELLIRRC